MPPAFKHDRGSGDSIDEGDFFGTHSFRGSNDTTSNRPDNETNVIRDGNDVILKQFEMKMIKREYSRNQASRDKKVSSTGAMILDWSGFPGAAHTSPRGERLSADRKSIRDRKGKSVPVATPSGDDEEIIVISQRPRHRVDGHGSSSRLPTSQRRLSMGDVPRALSADSALDRPATSPQHRNRRTCKRNGVESTPDVAAISSSTRLPTSQRRLSMGDVPTALSADSALNRPATSPQHRNRRTCKRNVAGSTPDVAAISRPASSRSSRRTSVDLGGSLRDVSISHREGGNVTRGGNGSGSGHRSLRIRRTTSGDRVERQRRPQSEKALVSSRRPQRQNSSGGTSRRTPRTGSRIARSQSPASARRRKSASPHPSTRGLAAASATTLDTRRKISSQPSRSRRGSSLESSNGDFMSAGLKKQSSFKW